MDIINNCYSNFSAIYGVLYDKTFNEWFNYVDDENIVIMEQDRITDDTFKNYISIENYNNENDSKRIKDENSMYTKFVWLFSPPIKIIDNIYLGNAINSKNKLQLDENNIKLIINVTSEISNHFEDEIDYIKIPIKDNNNEPLDKEILESTYQKILEYQSKENSGNIMVHCMMGLSRSVTIITYYIMRKLKHEDGSNYTYDDAYNLISEAKPIINPTFRLVKDATKAVIHYNN